MDFIDKLKTANFFNLQV